MEMHLHQVVVAAVERDMAGVRTPAEVDLLDEPVQRRTSQSVQYGTAVQYGTTQYSAVQHSTAPLL